MTYILLSLTVLLAGLRSVLSKVGNKYMTTRHDIYVFNFWLFLSGGAVISIKCLTNNSFEISFYTFILAMFYALFTLMSQILFMKATECGDVGLSSLIYSCGFLFPTLLGAFAYNEEITILKILGILIILFSFAVGTISKNKPIIRKWFIYAFSAMFSSGMVGVIQKVFRMSSCKEQLNEFLLIAFLGIIVFMLAIMPKGKEKKFPKGFFISSIFIGICFGTVNIINTYLSGVMPSIIMFPVVNGGGIVSSGILASLIIKERMAFRKWLSILVCVIGIILVAI